MQDMNQNQNNKTQEGYNDVDLVRSASTTPRFYIYALETLEIFLTFKINLFGQS